jgi:Flp pilus assembly protein TadB
MKKSGRSPNNSSLEKLRIELLFKEEIEENNLFLAASLAYLFGVLYACLTDAVERYFGIILILTAVMIIWFLRDKRKEIRRRYEKEIESLLTSGE